MEFLVGWCVMAPPAEIPGFFWDERKQKYFKILPSGKATVSQLNDEDTAMQRYTISSIAREKRWKLRRTANPPQAIAATHANLEMVSMSMRLNRPEPLNFQGIEAQRLGDLQDYSRLHVFKNELVHALAWDDVFMGLYCGTSAGTYACLGQGGLSWSVGYRGRVVTSIGFNSCCAASVSVDEDVGSFINICPRSSVQKGHRFMIPRGNIVSSLAMAADSVALGTTDGIVDVDAGTGIQAQLLRTESALLAVDARADSRYAGCRNGRVAIFDTRSAQPASTITHGSTVTHLKEVNQNQLVVCGLEDKMTLYDTRTLKPLLQFKGYYNYSSPFHGFSVDPSQGMAAVALDDGAIQVYDLSNGSLLASPSTASSSSTSASLTPVRALAWSHDALFVGDQYTVLSSERARLPSPTRTFGLEEFELEGSRLSKWPIFSGTEDQQN